MPRRARISIANIPYHVTQRGNNRQDVFFVDDDRRTYLSLLKHHCDDCGLEILGWCLMPNHIHLIARPSTDDALSKALGRTHFHYTQYINRLHARTGHLWQNRFYSCPLGRQHFWQAMRYIEQNPLRAGIVRHACDYPWSSAKAHVAARDATGLLNLAYWRQIASQIDWSAVLQKNQPPALVDQLRLSTRTGRPLADDAFLSKLETLLNKRLRPLPPGRPTKPKTRDRHRFSC